MNVALKGEYKGIWYKCVDDVRFREDVQLGSENIRMQITQQHQDCKDPLNNN